MMRLAGAAALVCLAGACLAPCAAAYQNAGGSPSAPQQPIAFSHLAHAGTLKLPCKMCHLNPNPGDEMTIAPAATCMQCHSAIKTGSPEIQKLAAFAKSGKPIPWARVYELPSFVIFSHRTHIAQGVQCQTCHGPVATRAELFRETNFTMGFCVDCHTAKKATVDCGACHDLPN